MIVPQTFPCVSCGYVMNTQMVKCPGCMCDYSHLLNPTSPEGIEKKEKHLEIVLSGTLSLGTGPGKFNASFDHNGAASLDKIIRFTAAFGHRDQISSGPGRPPNDVRVVLLPEIVASGASKFWSGNKPCSGACIISPGHPVYGHVFPAMDEWIKHHDKGTVRKCVRCSNEVSFGNPFCSNCYADLGSDWRSFIA